MNTSIFTMHNELAYCEAKGISKCFQTYADECTHEIILEIGFNENSGYTYIALENGITIASMLGELTKFIVTNPDSGEEYFFNTYEEALEYFNA